MVVKIDLVGEKFGYLTVLREDASVNGRLSWFCSCVCGKTLSVKSNSLRTGNTKSCGCYRIERVIATSSTHGMSSTKLYEVWCNMKSRCDNTSSDFYYDYGGRGIKYCDRWMYFENFLDDIGERYERGLSLERIDVNGDYSKENCCWIPLKDQAKNRRRPTNNTSGYTGVCEYFRDGRLVSYRARWVENNKVMAKYFSVKRYSDAFERACYFRQEQIERLGYGFDHGK